MVEVEVNIRLFAKLNIDNESDANTLLKARASVVAKMTKATVVQNRDDYVDSKFDFDFGT